MDTLHAAALKDTANLHTHKKKKVGKRKKKEEEELFTRPQESKRADASSTGAHNERKGEE